MVAALFRISVYDGNRVFKCQIGSPTNLTVTVRHNLPGTLTMTVPLSHPRASVLLEPKTRLRVLFRGEHLISGPITDTEIETEGVGGHLTVTVEDDFRVLREVLGWQVPGSAISSQGSAEFKVYKGNAETVLKNVVTDNGVNRLAIPGLTIAPNLNRGSVIPGGVAFRMHPGMDLLFPAVETAGLGVTVKQTGANLVLDVHQPATHPRSLSVEGRTLKRVAMTRSRPKASRAVVGGGGEGRDRYFRIVTDTAREALYGFCGEVFVDAASTGSDYLKLVKDVADANQDLKEKTSTYNKANRAYKNATAAQASADAAFDLGNLTTGDPGTLSKLQSALNRANTEKADALAELNEATTEKNTAQTTYDNLNAQLPQALTDYHAAMDEEGLKALTESGITNGVSITLAESGIFKYGPGGFHVGDRVPIKVADGVTVTEVIRECTLEWVSPYHAQVDPTVGEMLNQPERVTAKRLQALAKGQRNQEKR